MYSRSKTGGSRAKALLMIGVKSQLSELSGTIIIKK